jgi:hypothetical protein
MGKFRGATPTKPAFSDKEKALPKPVSTNDQKPVFSFEYMQDGSGYSVNCCEAEDRAQLSARLFQITQLTWMEINQAGRHGMGTEIIPRDKIEAKIPSAVSDDTRLLAFRYNGKRPMVGYRDGRMFYILWLDWNFTLYPHG